MIDQDYTIADLKRAMLNEACPKMEGFYSDLYEDFESLDKLQIGETAQWFYRKYGTSFRIEDKVGFERDCKFWTEQIFKVFTILRTGSNKYSVMENKLNVLK